MELNFVHLDSTTRQFMVEEVELDIENGTLHEIPYLNEQSKWIYPTLLKKAVSLYTSCWLASHLYQANCLSEDGTETSLSCPLISTTLAQIITLSEFNRFYMRGLCKRAVFERQESILFYRVQDADELLGSPIEEIFIQVKPSLMLAQLRSYPGDSIYTYSRQGLKLL